MKAILIIAHGSRRAESNAEIEQLTTRVRAEASSEIGCVEHAFLEITSPTVEEAVAGLAKRGAVRIEVFPHFLAAGTHVVKDIPAVLQKTESRFPQISFRILPHLGGLDGISRLILNAADRFD
jgi:sirohydrochlorin ferrochelatase